MDTKMDFRSNEAGSTLPIFALALTAVIGLVGASLALGMDGRSANNLQLSADSAALAGATAFINATSPRAKDREEEARRTAIAVAQQNADYVLTHAGVGSIVEDPYGQHTRIDVEIEFEPVNAMAKVAGRTSNIDIRRRASATATWGFPLCILSLSTKGRGLRTRGTPELLAENCVIWTNSKSRNSMTFRGGRAETKHFCSAGGVVDKGARVKPRPVEQCDAIPDPLEDWRAPAHAVPEILSASSKGAPVSRDTQKLLKELDKALGKITATEDGKALASALETGQAVSEATMTTLSESMASISETGGLLGSTLSLTRILDEEGRFLQGVAKGLSLAEVAQIIGLIDNLPNELWQDDSYFDSVTYRLVPGTYAGLDIYFGHVEMAPGVYHIVGAPLIVRRKATLTGKGVTIIFHGDDATFGVLDGARLTLTAPEAGETAGFALAENRHASLDDSHPLRARLTGEGKIEAIGTVYLPRQQLAITGEGAGEQASPLLQIVADTVDMSNNGHLKIIFDTSKTDVPVKIKPERTARLLH